MVSYILFLIVLVDSLTNKVTNNGSCAVVTDAPVQDARLSGKVQVKVPSLCVPQSFASGSSPRRSPKSSPRSYFSEPGLVTHTASLKGTSTCVPVNTPCNVATNTPMESPRSPAESPRFFATVQIEGLPFDFSQGSLVECARLSQSVPDLDWKKNDKTG